VREFSSEYLTHTRRGLWADSRAALKPLSLEDRTRILDVGAGTGEFAQVLDAESPGDVICLDLDSELLSIAHSETGLSTIIGDATQLPIRSDAVDLVTCQALLSNLPNPIDILQTFTHVSCALVAAVEPDNAAVSVSSTVKTEADIERQAREAYIAGVQTDVALGDRLTAAFDEAGLNNILHRRHYHHRTTEPPYDDTALTAAARKAHGTALRNHYTELRRELSPDAYDTLRRDWRAMGRAVIDQIRNKTYRRTEIIPFDVVVGRVPSTGQ
jgi:Methylase involved in ubiquinone/menaquinone biosynthesis